MQRNTLIGIIILVALILGGSAYLYITRPVQVPAENINDQTVPLESSTDESNNIDAMGSANLYQVDQSSSSATFTIDEELRGSPFTVVGETNQIAGEFRIKADANDSMSLSIGQIKVDARTFKTDSQQRDGAIVRLILKSELEGNEYVTFTPAEETLHIPTLSAEPVSISIPGTLTVSQVTKPVTLTASVSLKEGGLTADITAPLKRSDFELAIPNLPFIANVSDSFVISGHIVATAR